VHDSENANFIQTLNYIHHPVGNWSCNKNYFIQDFSSNTAVPKLLLLRYH